MALEPPGLTTCDFRNTKPSIDLKRGSGSVDLTARCHYWTQIVVDIDMSCFAELIHFATLEVEGG